MVLVSPPGYGKLTLVDRTKHRNRGVRVHATRFAAGLHTIYVSAIEFIAAARWYPLVFARDNENRLHPFAVVGLEVGQNLMVDTNGDWRRDAYCPAYVRRYPFCTAETAGDGVKQSVICVDEAGLDDTTPHLFDHKGVATPRWQEIQRFITEVDVARRQTAGFCRQLDELALLDYFEADVNPLAGKRKRLVGMLRVDEGRLNALNPQQIKDLMATGSLARIYAHLMSLDNFQRLLDLESTQSQRAAAPP